MQINGYERCDVNLPKTVVLCRVLGFMFGVTVSSLYGALSASAAPPASEISVGASGRLTHDYDSDGATENASVTVGASGVKVEFSGATGSGLEDTTVTSVVLAEENIDRVFIDTLPAAVSGIPFVRVVVRQGEEACGSTSTVYLVSLTRPSNPKALISLTYVEDFDDSPARSSTTARFIPSKRQVVLDTLMSNEVDETKSTRRLALRDGVFVPME